MSENVSLSTTNDAPLTMTANGVEYIQVKEMDERLQAIMRRLADTVERYERDARETARQMGEMAVMVDQLAKDVRMTVTLTRSQVDGVNDAIRTRARVLLGKYGVTSAAAVIRLANVIRKDVLKRWAAKRLDDVPRCEYQVAVRQASGWIDAKKLMEIVEGAMTDNEVHP